MALEDLVNCEPNMNSACWINWKPSSWIVRQVHICLMLVQTLNHVLAYMVLFRTWPDLDLAYNSLSADGIEIARISLKLPSMTLRMICSGSRYLHKARISKVLPSKLALIDPRPICNTPCWRARCKLAWLTAEPHSKLSLPRRRPQGQVWKQRWKGSWPEGEELKWWPWLRPGDSLSAVRPEFCSKACNARKEMMEIVVHARKAWCLNIHSAD